VTEKTSNTIERHNFSRYFLWLRTLFGLCILTVIVVWVINKGILLERLNSKVLVWSTLISILTSILHAATLSSIAYAYGRKLNYRYALYISALGSLGNAAGGLPLGTTLKYIILYKRVGLKIGQITFGLTAYTMAIALVLLAYATVCALLLNLRPDIKVLPGLLLIVSIISIIALGCWGQRSKVITNLLNPFLGWKFFLVVAALSFSLASLFILNSVTVGYFLFPEHSFIHITFLSATGIFISLVSFLQSIAGIQELAMGLSAFFSGIESIDGVQIALVMRFTAIISSGLILGLSYLLPEKTRPS
jgi:hypothetical protein